VSVFFDINQAFIFAGLKFFIAISCAEILQNYGDPISFYVSGVRPTLFARNFGGEKKFLWFLISFGFWYISSEPQKSLRYFS
jgi:hypothetical protein